MKYIFWLIVLIALVAGGIWYFGKASTPATTTAIATSSAATTTVATGAIAFIPTATSSALSVSTVPFIGDTNPYGVAFVPVGFPSGGPLNPGDVLVSNWNNQSLQGGGTTIVRITPTGAQSLFFQGKPGLGLTTALAVLRSGFVIVGNLPTTDGTGATAKAGSILILGQNGKLLTTLTDSKLIDGPWDMAVYDNGAQAQLFVSNVLSGTVVRFDMTFDSSGVTSHVGTVIASGYAHHTDPAAAVVGPTGLVYQPSTDTLFVASTVDNAIYSIPNAGSATSSLGMGTLVYQDPTHLHGPVGLAMTPTGDFLTTQGDAINPDPAQPSELVEFTPAGAFVRELSLDAAPGAAFGLAVNVVGATATLAAVDDDTSSLFLWSMPVQ